MKMYKKTNEFLKLVFLPLVAAAVLQCIGEILTLLQGALSGNAVFVFEEIAVKFYTLIPYVFAFFIPYYFTDGKKTYKGIWSVFCFALLSGCFSALSEVSPHYILGLAVGGFCAFCFSRFDYKIALPVTFSIVLLFGLLFGYLYDGYENIIIKLTQFVGSRGSVSALLFGFLKNLFEPFSDLFGSLIYTKSYGGAQFIDGTMVTGVKNIYELSKGASQVHTYLSGQYLMLFSVLGMSLALSDEMKEHKKVLFWILAGTSIISGNFSFFMFFILLQSPFLFLYGCILSALAYLAGSLLSLSSGFLNSGGLIEMFMNLDRPAILLASCVTMGVISYFVFKYGLLKYDIAESENKYIPQRLISFVEALGGIHNIIKVKDNGVELRNTKLLDSVKLDGEIKENIFLFEDERLIDLKEYL